MNHSLRFLPCSVALLIASAYPTWSEPPDEGDAGPRPFLVRLEESVGRSLTPDERQAIRRASGKMAEALREEQNTFIAAIARAVRLPESKIREFIPRVGEGYSPFDKNMIPKIERELGRSIRSSERDAIRKADEKKKSEMAKPRSEFCDSVARTVGTKPERVEALLPKIGL